MDKNQRKRIKTILVLIVLIAQFVIITVAADDETSISVLLDNNLVSGSETFTVSIYCEPGQSIKAFELSVSFDETLLQANSVSEGDFFEGYETFFNSGIIDNDIGTIIHIYNLILGPGNVTSSGNLVDISFTAQGVSGISQITLPTAGVTNETMYLPLSVNNGSVQIDATAPSIVDNSPSFGTTGDPFTFNVSVTDNVDDSSEVITKVDWSHDGSGANESMVFTGGSYFEKTVTLDHSISLMSYTIYVQDTSGNSMTTSASSVTVSDNDAPSISNIQISPPSQLQDGSVNLSAEIVDNIALMDVSVLVIYPDDSSTNVSVFSNPIGDTFYLYQSYTVLGSYSVVFYAIDTSGNTVLSDPTTFIIIDVPSPVIGELQVDSSDPLDTEAPFGWVNFSVNIYDDDLLLVTLNYTDRQGLSSNVSMTQISSSLFYFNTTLGVYGNYSYYIWCIDASGYTNKTAVLAYSLPPNYDINMDGTIDMLDLSLISNRFKETEVLGWIREDVNNDGMITVLDLVMVSNHYNESWW